MQSPPLRPPPLPQHYTLRRSLNGKAPCHSPHPHISGHTTVLAVLKHARHDVATGPLHLFLFLKCSFLGPCTPSALTFLRAFHKCHFSVRSSLTGICPLPSSPLSHPLHYFFPIASTHHQNHDVFYYIILFSSFPEYFVVSMRQGFCLLYSLL